jgi:hypothetical protein
MSNLNLFIVVGVIVILFIIFMKRFKPNKSESFDNIDIDIDIGNNLSTYFHDFGEALLNKEDFILYKQYHSIPFFRHLPKVLKFDTYKDLYEKMINGRNGKDKLDKTFINKYTCSMCLWEVHNTKIEFFWLCMKPYVYKIINDALIKDNLKRKIDYATVIHFRCADAPINRHMSYHFQRYLFFKEAIDNINRTTNVYNENKKILIMYNNIHRSNDDNKKACNIYAEELKKYIENLGYNVDIHSDSNITDFATLFYAPSVISTGSSFSFMSSFFGGNKFISAGHYTEINLETKCKECDDKDWLIKEYDVNHKDIKDYYDTTQVINLLQQ